MCVAGSGTAGGKRAMNVLDANIVSAVAAALKTDESFVEKDWHVVRALSIVAAVPEDGVCAVFSGGTSLAKGWGLIKRFSEDIDFKVGVNAPNPSAARTRRSRYREKVLPALAQGGFDLDREPLIGNASQFFRASFDYGARLRVDHGLRPSLKIEMTFSPPALEPHARSARLFVAEAEGKPPEVAEIFCVDPIETAADKLSALAWRTHVRDRTSRNDDPSIVRHLHDLAAMEPTVSGRPAFVALARRTLEVDEKRTKDTTFSGMALVQRMLPLIENDPRWNAEYEQFVDRVAFGPEDQRIAFDAAIAACRRLVALVLDGDR